MRNTVGSIGRFMAVRAAIGSLISLSTVGVLLAGAGIDSAQAKSVKTTTVSLNLIPVSSAAPFYVGMKEGFFAKNHLKLKITLTPTGGAVIVPAIESGQDDFGTAGYSDLATAVSKGFPLVSIATVDSAGPSATSDFQYLATLKSSGISTLRGLIGKTVAVSSLNGLTQVQVEAALHNAGLNYHQVNFDAIQFPQMGEALTQKQVDAIATIEPFYTQTMQQASLNTLAALDYAIAPNLPVETLMTTKKYYSAHPMIVKEMQLSVQEAQQYITKHPSVARSVLPSYTSVTAALAKQVKMPYFRTTTNMVGLQKLVSDMKAYGIISSAPALKSFLRLLPS